MTNLSREMKGVGRVLSGGVECGLAANALKLLTLRLLRFRWTEPEPLPLTIANLWPVVLGLFMFTCGHPAIERWLTPA